MDVEGTTNARTHRHSRGAVAGGDWCMRMRVRCGEDKEWKTRREAGVVVLVKQTEQQQPILLSSRRRRAA